MTGARPRETVAAATGEAGAAASQETRPRASAMELDSSAKDAGSRVMAFERLDSTNARTLELARSGVAGPLWVTAREQYAGRGRRGKGWVSEPGNLFASLLLTDPAPQGRAAELPLVAVVALREAAVCLDASLAPRLAVKWPNDLLLDGLKVAGLLLEAETTGARTSVVAGFGVNCRHHPSGTAYAATDFASAGCDRLTAESVFRALSRTMQAWLTRWDRGRGFAAVRAEWMAHVAGIGTEIRVRHDNGEIMGRFETLDETGRLVLLCPDGRRLRISAGEVFALGVPHPGHNERTGA